VLTIFFLRPRRKEKDTKKKREKREKNSGFRQNKRGTNKKQKKEGRGRIVSLLFKIARVCVYIIYTHTHTKSPDKKEEEIW
jgi:ribosomal protein S6E (S10)